MNDGDSPRSAKALQGLFLFGKSIKRWAVFISHSATAVSGSSAFLIYISFTLRLR